MWCFELKCDDKKIIKRFEYQDECAVCLALYIKKLDIETGDFKDFSMHIWYEEIKK